MIGHWRSYKILLQHELLQHQQPLSPDFCAHRCCTHDDQNILGDSALLTLCVNFSHFEYNSLCFYKKMCFSILILKYRLTARNQPHNHDWINDPNWELITIILVDQIY